MRKLPIYILIDTSGSMKGEPIESVKVGLANLFSSLKQDSYAKENSYISVITFDLKAKLVLPLTAVSRVKLPEIPPLVSSPTNLGEALELLCQRYNLEVRRSSGTIEGDYLPMAVVMTDGSPSDTLLFSQMCEHIKSYPFASILGCAAGPKAKIEPLTKFCHKVVTLDIMDSNSFSKFWVWVTDSITKHDSNIEEQVDDLPPLPPEIRIAF
ncbi:MAG: VWA domain-containing protein [Deltaproteobacteria bacterium]|jgi:uncharacterized protein YegL|nr:VWA domain-containing protein [Deltaproteobacteria bacterium]